MSSNDGKAALVVRDGRAEDSDGEAEPPSKFLKRGEVYLTPLGERIVTIATSEGLINKQWSLDHQLTRHVECEIMIQGGPLDVKGTIDGVVMSYRRFGNSKIYWNMLCVYDCLGLKIFNKIPSKWVWHCTKSWQDYTDNILGVKCLIFGKHRNGKTRQQEFPWFDRCLQSTASSTVGLLLLLTRWALVRRERGGFECIEDRAAAVSLLKTLVGAVMEFRNKAPIVLMLDADWKCQWPRPDTGSLLGLVFVPGRHF